MRIKKDHNISGCRLGADGSGPDQPLAFRVPYQAHFAIELLDVVVQASFQVF